MVCVYCSKKTQVINTRHQTKHNQIWRRRKCSACHAIFTSLETTDFEQLWLVINKKGQLQPFLTDKLYLSVYDSLKHRSSARSDARHITRTVVSLLLGKIENGTINSSLISDTTKVSLNRFDKTASIHYQAFH